MSNSSRQNVKAKKKQKQKREGAKFTQQQDKRIKSYEVVT